MQYVWQEVGDNKSIRECVLYEASDLLLGDHLTEKSVTVKYVDVSMPHKRNRRLRSHTALQAMALLSPSSENSFEDNLVDTHYPLRPQKLQIICLYDLMAKYEWQTRDKNGDRKVVLLSKPRLPNHKLFDPAIELQ